MSNMNNPSASSEIETKPKRRPSIIRFGNRCRQMLASTKQNNPLRLDYLFLIVSLFVIKKFLFYSSVIFNNQLNLYKHTRNTEK